MKNAFVWLESSVTIILNYGLNVPGGAVGTGELSAGGYLAKVA